MVNAPSIEDSSPFLSKVGSENLVYLQSVLGFPLRVVRGTGYQMRLQYFSEILTSRMHERALQAEHDTSIGSR